MGESKFQYLNSSDDSFGAGKGTTGFINGHEYVDLGLSVKWATCNVGASTPEEYGDYYAWGETETKSEYAEENSVTHLRRMGSIAGNPRYDAATANWGGTWRMPTKEEIDELIGKCTWKWTEMEGHKGYEVTGPNGNSIFLPAAGWRYESSLDDVGEYGCYWSATPDGDFADCAYYLHFYKGLFYGRWDDRDNGQSVRPVIGKTSETGKSQSSVSPSGSATTSSATNSSSGTASPTIGIINGHDYVDLGLSVKWATCNVGASSPSGYGNYYCARGETKTKSEYTSDNSITYLKRMGSIAGDPQYDAATANWGGIWRMPTKEEMGELIDKCTWRWAEMDGHKGYEVTGPNGRSIFLPAAGWRCGSSLYGVGEDGYYWSATPDGDYAVNAYYLDFDEVGFGGGWAYRGDGLSVRPVSD